MDRVDLAIVGAGAAGLMAAIQAARLAPGRSILLLDGQTKPGAKLKVSGGGRCNLTHRRVGVSDYHGDSPRLWAPVLKAFPVPATLEFFAGLGVDCVEEEGRIYPASQRAADVWTALVAETRRRGIAWRTGEAVRSVERRAEGFQVEAGSSHLAARRVILATGGLSLPRSGSNGSGHALASALGLGLATPLVPGLSPLGLPEGHPLRELAGVACEVELRVPGRPGRWRGAMLLTHFGISGPVVLDVSRHLLKDAATGGSKILLINWLPDLPEEAARLWLAAPGGAGRVAQRLGERLPARLAGQLLKLAGLSADLPLARLERSARERLLKMLKCQPLDVVGARSWHHAECTAGGVRLQELDLGTLEARAVPGLHVCGELCDVDGRLGGFNFQWAWSSGAVAGRAAARGVEDEDR